LEPDKVSPSCAVPVIAGNTELTGTAGKTALVATLAAGLLFPPEFDAVTSIVMTSPTCAEVGVNTFAICPAMGTPLENH
jgi:hypothetical protein